MADRTSIEMANKVMHSNIFISKQNAASIFNFDKTTILTEIQYKLRILELRKKINAMACWYSSPFFPLIVKLALESHLPIGFSLI